MPRVDLSTVEAISFDIGGVVAADFWEAVFFNEEVGIVKQLRLDRHLLEEVGTRLWRKYCMDAFSEEDYWTEFNEIVGSRPTYEQVAAAESAVWADPTFAETVRRLIGLQKQVFIVSDNTAFWFPKQMRRLSAEGLFRDQEIIVSWRVNRRKKTKPRGSYANLAERTDPRKTLVVEDRSSNVEIAATEGFLTIEYIGSHESRVSSAFDLG